METINPSPNNEIQETIAVPAPPSKPRPKRFIKNQIPDSILNDASLTAAIALLPPNYSFEIHKFVRRVRSAGAKRVALQFPEGLLMYSLTISDIRTAFADVDRVFVDSTVVPCLYVFVDIKIDADRLINTVKVNLDSVTTKQLVLAGTIQFSTAIRAAKPELEVAGLQGMKKK